MNEFLNEKVNIIVATNSGSGVSSSTSAGALQNITNNTINIRGTLKVIEKNFIVLEDVQLSELPQYVSTRDIGTINYSYKKTAVNIDKIITISIV